MICRKSAMLNTINQGVILVFLPYNEGLLLLPGKKEKHAAGVFWAGGPHKEAYIWRICEGY